MVVQAILKDQDIISNGSNEWIHDNEKWKWHISYNNINTTYHA